MQFLENYSDTQKKKKNISEDELYWIKIALSVWSSELFPALLMYIHWIVVTVKFYIPIKPDYFFCIALLNKVCSGKPGEGRAYCGHFFVNFWGACNSVKGSPLTETLYEASLNLLENKQKWQDRSGPAEFWCGTAWHFSQILLKFKFADKMQLLLSNVRAKEES